MSYSNKFGGAEPCLCPSAQPSMPDAHVFGIVIGGEANPEVAWLEEPLPVSEELLAKVEGAEPQQVFRVTAPCQESLCVHYDGAQCQLAVRIVQILPAVTEALPPCRLRASCRWYLQEGRPACLRCPQVITHNYQPSEQVLQAARPA
jgi:hypothetical protein